MVRPILEMKYRMGLFENPYVDLEKFKAVTASSQMHQTAHDAAVQTAVLLRNQGNLLPLKKTVGSVALIGPMVDSQVDIQGGWSLHSTPSDAITIASGLKEKLPNAKLLITKGVEIERGQPSIFEKC